jgi:pimeloyl-ACP methyl ester carboxylesterase
MTRFTHDGCDINYEIRGEGPHTLLFNGSGASMESSAPLINALAKTMTVLVHDQRGLGESSVPEGPYSMAQYAADGHALVRHVGWNRCNVVGISFGGMVAQEFAVTFPGVVEKLVLLCTSAGGAAGASYPLHELGALTAEERLARQMELTDSRFVDESWLAEHPVEATIVAGMRDRATVTKTAERLRGERLQLEARMHHDVSDRLVRVTAPTFVLAGRYDGIAPVANSEQIVARIPDSSMQVYEGGHMFSGQDRNAILDIRRFIDTGERPVR